MVSPPPDGAAPLKAPISDVDPFSSDFFENPFAAHEELREAGPVVRLSRYGVWAAAGYQEVHAILNAARRICSRRVRRGDHAARDTGELTEEEAPIVARSLLTAGVDTTVSGIGAAVYCLARFPEQSLARVAFEEAVRYESLVQTFFRTTTRPVEIGGASVDESEKVLLFLGAANRDPRQWERADEYDITRRVIGHVGFGCGIHQCVGRLLARLEGECVLSALARKVVSVEITGPTKRRYNNTLRALASLPVTLRPA